MFSKCSVLYNQYDILHYDCVLQCKKIYFKYVPKVIFNLLRLSAVSS